MERDGKKGEGRKRDGKGEEMREGKR